jgi:pyruvate carboxylase
MTQAHTLPLEVEITVKPAIGGFIVTYPKYVEGFTHPVYVKEVVNTVGKAMRLVKAATEEFSLVIKSKDEAEAA